MPREKELPYDPAILFLGIYSLKKPRDSKRCVYTHVITALFAIVEGGNNPNVYQWINVQTKYGLYVQ